jgi:hypothetical protein
LPQIPSNENICCDANDHDTVQLISTAVVQLPGNQESAGMASLTSPSSCS